MQISDKIYGEKKDNVCGIVGFTGRQQAVPAYDHYIRETVYTVENPGNAGTLSTV